MIYGVFSDIHGYPEYLDLAVKQLKIDGAEDLMCLGDLVGYGPDPEGAVKQMQEYGSDVRCLMGNHDYETARYEPPGMYSLGRREPMETDIEHSRLLDSEDKDFLLGLPESISEANVLFCHSFMVGPRNWVRPRLKVESKYPFFGMKDVFDRVQEAILIVGHSHQPGVFAYDEHLKVGSKLAPEFDWIDLTGFSRLLIDVGSVSIPRDDFGRTCVLFDDVRMRVKFVRVPESYRRMFV